MQQYDIRSVPGDPVCDPAPVEHDLPCLQPSESRTTRLPTSVRATAGQRPTLRAGGGCRLSHIDRGLALDHACSWVVGSAVGVFACAAFRSFSACRNSSHTYAKPAQAIGIVTAISTNANIARKTPNEPNAFAFWVQPRAYPKWRGADRAAEHEGAEDGSREELLRRHLAVEQVARRPEPVEDGCRQPDRDEERTAG